MKEILKFFTGSSKIPATGFDGTPKIYFCNEDRLPSVSTCDLSITFPFGFCGIDINFKHRSQCVTDQEFSADHQRVSHYHHIPSGTCQRQRIS